MAIESDENKPEEEEGATPTGMVEAVTQDVELIVDKVMDTAGNAVVVVQEKLGMRPAPSRAKKPAKPKAKAKAPAVKAKAPALKVKAPAPKMKARPVAKATATKFAKAKVSKAVAAKPRKVAKSAKRAAKPAPPKGKKAKGRR
jgi:hypothetical protein